jgi:hypothetical protein
MKTKILITAFVSVFCLPPSAFGQGVLTPPGAPAPTMKSLDQIEARTPVDAVNTPGNVSFQFYINQPGSYYLTANVAVSGKSGIGISANNVTLDLNGFSLQGGVSGLISGIYAYNTCSNITIHNGAISGWNRGVNCFANNVVLEHLMIFDNLIGMQCANSVVIRDCTFLGNGAAGVELDGADSLIVGNNFVGNNTANSPAYGAIYITGFNNRIEGNHVTGSGSPGNGILIFNSPSITNNIVIKNSVEGGGASNYSINTSYNDVGPIGSASTNTSPWGNISH